MARTHRFVVVALLAVTAIACGDDQSAGSPSARPSPDVTNEASEAPASSPPIGATPSPSVSTAFDPGSVLLSLEPVTDGLEAPLAVTHAGDGSGRLFVVEQRGQVRVVSDGRLLADPFLDLGDRTRSGGERGLLGLAFHPAFPDDPRLFVDYTDANGNTVVASFTVDSPTANRADLASEEVLLRIEQPFANHNGGAVAFGPDGYLYISIGDGGSGGDPLDSGQRRNTLLGKVLRIDVDGSTADEPYAIPPDNPFVDDAEAAPEIWHTGLRNPWRMSFDRLTGDLWIGDVGQGSWEEVDVARVGAGGLNFGWNRMEGFACFANGACQDPSFTLPVTAYSHDEGCSVVGGLVYRGERQPILSGGYVYADYCSGNLWLLDPTTDGPIDGILGAETGRAISAIGEDETGEVMVTDLDAGELLRVVATER